MASSFEFTFKKTFLTVIIVGVLAGMGTWQLQRKAEKEKLISTIADRQAMEPLKAIPAEMSSDEYINLDYRKAVLTGLIEESKIVYMGPRTFDGRMGYHQLTPMMLPDKKVILLNEGFVPADWATSPHETREKVETVSGTLRLPALPGPFTPLNPPENSPNHNMFYWMDMLAIGNALGAPRLLPLVFELDRYGDSYPIGGQTQLVLPNDHLKYAITWFALAFAMVVVYLVSSIRRHSSLAHIYGIEQANQHDQPPLHGPAHGQKKSRSNTGEPPSLW